MDLKAILQKTKVKSEKVTSTRKPPSIAWDERPYLIKSIEPTETVQTEQVSVIKLETNQRQIKDKIKDKSKTNQRQNAYITETNHSTPPEIGDRIEDNFRDKLETNQVLVTPTQDKFITVKNNKQATSEPFSCLVGLQRKIVLFLFEECKLNRARITQPLTIEYVASNCASTVASTKKSLQRLEQKNVILRSSFKRGRSGWTQYELADQTYNEILYSENYRQPYGISNWRQMKDKLEPQLETELETSPTSSSSNFINTTTTELTHEWKKIDITPLKTIQFTEVELKNIFKKCPSSISPEVVQDSIYQFAFGLKTNPARYRNMKSPVAVFVNHLIQGNPWMEEGYISPEDLAKQEKETLMTTMLEQQFKESKFMEWFNKTEEAKREDFVPVGTRASTAYSISKFQIQKEYAKNYFEKMIWPNLLVEMKKIFLS